MRVREGDRKTKAEVRKRKTFEMGCRCFEDGRKGHNIKNVESL